MCLLFHKWPKWSAPRREVWSKRYRHNGAVVPGSESTIIRLAQERTCLKCGEYQKRFIEEED